MARTSLKTNTIPISSTTTDGKVVFIGENGLFARVAREKGLNKNNSKGFRLEEAEGNSPGQRPVVIITSPICDAPKVHKSFPYSIKDFFQEFENFLSFELLKNKSARLCRFALQRIRELK